MRKLLYPIIIVLFFIGCKKDEIAGDNIEANNQLYKLMQEEYLWYNNIPSIDPNQYTSPFELIEHLRYSEKDKWSFVMNLNEFEALFKESKYIGYGFGIGKTTDGKFYISVIFDDSPAFQDNVKRGWQITKINNTTLSSSSNINEMISGNTNTFTFLTPNNIFLTKTYSKREVKMNTVVHKSVHSVNGKKIGYLVFHSFLEQSEQELNEAFSFFKSENITNLIIDLRYNGGGMMSIANQLANLIAGKIGNGDIFTTLTHNNKKSDKNSNYRFAESENSLSVNSVVAITTSSSASASEALINGLDPIIPVTLVGQKTHGKPVGMYVFQYEQYVFAPICFKTVNKNNKGDYFNGIEVNFATQDDITKDFGNENEASLKAAIDFITTGTVVPTRAINQSYIEQFDGINSFITAY